MKPFAEASEDWEPPVLSSGSISQTTKEPLIVQQTAIQTDKSENQTGFQGMIMNQVNIFASLCMCELSL